MTKLDGILLCVSISFAVVVGDKSVSSVCGFPINVTSRGILTSPNYPSGYPLNQRCNWLLTSGVENTKIKLKVVDMDIEPIFDNLNIFNGPTTDSPLVSQLWGKGSDILVGANSTSVLLVFVSDTSITGKGFKLMYTLSNQVRRKVPQFKVNPRLSLRSTGNNSVFRFDPKRNNMY